MQSLAKILTASEGWIVKRGSQDMLFNAADSCYWEKMLLRHFGEKMLVLAG